MWWDLWPWACRGKEEADDRSVGSDRYQAVGSCRGKGEAKDRSEEHTSELQSP